MVIAKKASAKTTAAKTQSEVPTPAGKLTKTQLVRYMAEKLDVPSKQIGAFLDLLVETAAEQTKTVGEFTLPGLGKLVKAERSARTGRNPATGQPVQIAAKTTVKFRVAKAMQDTLLPPKA